MAAFAGHLLFPKVALHAWSVIGVTGQAFLNFGQTATPVLTDGSKNTGAFSIKLCSTFVRLEVQGDRDRFLFCATLDPFRFFVKRKAVAGIPRSCEIFQQLCCPSANGHAVTLPTAAC